MCLRAVLYDDIVSLFVIHYIVCVCNLPLRSLQQQFCYPPFNICFRNIEFTFQCVEHDQIYIVDIFSISILLGIQPNTECIGRTTKPQTKCNAILLPQFLIWFNKRHIRSYWKATTLLWNIVLKWDNAKYDDKNYSVSFPYEKRNYKYTQYGQTKTTQRSLGLFLSFIQFEWKVQIKREFTVFFFFEHRTHRLLVFTFFVSTARMLCVWWFAVCLFSFWYMLSSSVLRCTMYDVRGHINASMLSMCANYHPIEKNNNVCRWIKEYWWLCQEWRTGDDYGTQC